MQTVQEQVAEVLTGAVEHIADPAHWTQGASVRDRGGSQLTYPDTEGPRATQFCAAAAIWREVFRVAGGDIRLYYAARDHVEAVLEVESLVGWNDNNEHAVIVAGMRKAARS